MKKQKPRKLSKPKELGASYDICLTNDDEYAAVAIAVDKYALDQSRRRLPQFTGKPPKRDFQLVLTGFQLVLNGLGIPYTPETKEFVDSTASAWWKVFRLAGL
jgi:hypothetical protein